MFSTRCSDCRSESEVVVAPPTLTRSMWHIHLNGKLWKEILTLNSHSKNSNVDSKLDTPTLQKHPHHAMWRDVVARLSIGIIF